MANQSRVWQGLSVALALLLTISFGRTGSAAVLEASFGVTAVTFDQAFLDRLTTLGVSVEATGNGELLALPPDPTTGAISTVASFPVVAGAADTNPAALALDLLHGGGLKFAVGETSAELSDYVYNTNNGVLQGRAIGQSPGGVVAVFTRTPLFSLDLSGIAVEQPSGILDTVQVTGIALTLTQEAADFLNSTFGLSGDTAFVGGTPVGTAAVGVVITD